MSSAQMPVLSVYVSVALSCCLSVFFVHPLLKAGENQLIKDVNGTEE